MKFRVNKEDKYFHFDELALGEVFKCNNTYYMKIAKVRTVPRTMPVDLITQCVNESLYDEYNAINLENCTLSCFRDNETVRFVDVELIINE